MPLPQYKCHKIVNAARITEIQKGVSSDPHSVFHDFNLVFGDIGASKHVTAEWVERFRPDTGGYYVVYEDGYASFSPAKAFEEGYTLIENTDG
jgi:hypothetical protein